MATMDKLIGRRIEGLQVSEGEENLIFLTDQGGVAYTTYGDCCSETWFADIVGVSGLLGEIVAKVEDIDMPAVEDGRTRQESDQFYGVRLTTAKGTADIVYRNSSNGYYGGSIEERAALPEGLTLRPITADWRA